MTEVTTLLDAQTGVATAGEGPSHGNDWVVARKLEKSDDRPPFEQGEFTSSQLEHDGNIFQQHDMGNESRSVGESTNEKGPISSAASFGKTLRTSDSLPDSQRAAAPVSDVPTTAATPTSFKSVDRRCSPLPPLTIEPRVQCRVQMCEQPPHQQNQQQADISRTEWWVPAADVAVPTKQDGGWGKGGKDDCTANMHPGESGSAPRPAPATSSDGTSAVAGMYTGVAAAETKTEVGVKAAVSNRDLVKNRTNGDGPPGTMTNGEDNGAANRKGIVLSWSDMPPVPSRLPILTREVPPPLVAAVSTHNFRVGAGSCSTDPGPSLPWTYSFLTGTTSGGGVVKFDSSVNSKPAPGPDAVAVATTGANNAATAGRNVDIFHTKSPAEVSNGFALQHGSAQKQLYVRLESLGNDDSLARKHKKSMPSLQDAASDSLSTPLRPFAVKERPKTTSPPDTTMTKCVSRSPFGVSSDVSKGCLHETASEVRVSPKVHHADHDSMRSPPPPVSDCTLVNVSLGTRSAQLPHPQHKTMDLERHGTELGSSRISSRHRQGDSGASGAIDDRADMKDGVAPKCDSCINTQVELPILSSPLTNSPKSQALFVEDGLCGLVRGPSLSPSNDRQSALEAEIASRRRPQSARDNTTKEHSTLGSTAQHHDYLEGLAKAAGLTGGRNGRTSSSSVHRHVESACQPSVISAKSSHRDQYNGIREFMNDVGDSDMWKKHRSELRRSLRLVGSAKLQSLSAESGIPLERVRIASRRRLASQSTWRADSTSDEMQPLVKGSIGGQLKPKLKLCTARRVAATNDAMGRYMDHRIKSDQSFASMSNASKQMSRALLTLPKGKEKDRKNQSNVRQSTTERTCPPPSGSVSYNRPHLDRQSSADARPASSYSGTLRGASKRPQEASRDAKRGTFEGELLPLNKTRKTGMKRPTTDAELHRLEAQTCELHRKMAMPGREDAALRTFALQYNEWSVLTVARWVNDDQPAAETNVFPLELPTAPTYFRRCGACGKFGHLESLCPRLSPLSASFFRNEIDCSIQRTDPLAVAAELCEGYEIEQCNKPFDVADQRRKCDTDKPLPSQVVMMEIDNVAIQAAPRMDQLLG